MAGRLRRSARPRPVHADPGLQPERTTLAWGRTVLSLVMTALIFLRWIPTHGSWALLPLLLACAGGGFLALGRRRIDERAIRSIAHERAQPPVQSVLALGGLVVTIGVVALAVI